VRRQPSTPRRTRTYRLQVIVEVDEDGKYVACCPALQGCYTQGDTFEEALAGIHDVIEMCLEELREEKREINLRYPEVVGIKTIEVAI
jgi:predicted RNase H-like HicB family nuclease